MHYSPCCTQQLCVAIIHACGTQSSVLPVLLLSVQSYVPMSSVAKNNSPQEMTMLDESIYSSYPCKVFSSLLSSFLPPFLYSGMNFTFHSLPVLFHHTLKNIFTFMFFVLSFTHFTPFIVLCCPTFHTSIIVQTQIKIL